MKIIDLKEKYPLVYEAALRNQRSQGNPIDDTLYVMASRSQGNFNWHDTPEGEHFWQSVHHFNFINAKDARPDLFVSSKAKVKLYKYIYRTNGATFLIVLKSIENIGYLIINDIMFLEGSELALEILEVGQKLSTNSWIYKNRFYPTSKSVKDIKLEALKRNLVV